MGTQTCPFIDVCDHLFTTGQTSVAATDTVWPAKPKISTLWPFKENVCCSLVSLGGRPGQGQPVSQVKDDFKVEAL